jgi:glycosyltransferase involved in cell wall biosynthesis
MSETAAQELVEHSGFPQHKLRGIVHSARVASLKTSPVLLDHLGILGADFILSVSHINHYKNYRELIQAYDLLGDNGELPPLVIAGRPRDRDCYRALIKLTRERGLANKVRFVGEVPRGSLYWLYNRCLFLVFSSTVETCPRTLIEAMKCGAPIACSDRSAMPEICGDAALYFDPDKPDKIATQMKQLLHSPQLRNDLRKRSLERAKCFSWDATARETLLFFEEVLDGTIR